MCHERLAGPSGPFPVCVISSCVSVRVLDGNVERELKKKNMMYLCIRVSERVFWCPFVFYLLIWFLVFCFMLSCVQGHKVT